MQDLVYAFRTIRRSPGFVAVVVLSIAIGIAANTTIFSMANAVLFGGLAVRDADRLVNLSNSEHGSSFSYPNYLDLRSASGFEDVAAHFPIAPFSVSAGSTPERAWGQLVSGNYFAVVGVPMSLGRGIRPEEDTRRDPVVVLSHVLWTRRFASDTGIVGRTVTMNNRAWTVVGVAAPGFRGTDRMLMPEFWVPLSFYSDILPELVREDPMARRDTQWIMLDARLKSGVSPREALAAVNVTNARLDETYRKAERRSRISLEHSGQLPADAGKPALSLFVGLILVAVLVLAIACANVANLMLARAADRQREIAVRLAIGAGRGRLIRQLLTESLVLSVFGSIAGFLLSLWAMAAISHVDLPIPIPVDLHLTPDLRVLAFTIGLSLLSAIVFGLAPALRATRPDLINAMKTNDVQIAGFRRFGMRNGLVVLQVTFSLVLLISAGLFLRSLGRASTIDLGMKVDPVLSVAFDPNQHGHSAEQKGHFLDDVKQRVSSLPGISSVSFVDFIPLSFVGANGRYWSTPDVKVRSSIVQVGDGYFETMGLPILAGRDFSREPARGVEVAILNRALAEKQFPGQNPLGRQIHDERHAYQVIGIAATAKQRTLGEGDAACLYVSLDQNLSNIMSLTGVALVAKSATPSAMLDPVRRSIQELDPNLAIYNAVTLRDQTEKAMLLPRLTATLFTIFGISGFALAMVGLYGVMSFSVGRRTKEIGIRMALGAERHNVLAMIASQGLILTMVGIAAGLAISLAASRFAASLLYGVSPRDAVTFIAVPLALIAVAFVASVIPARRAAKLDPMQALRYE